MKQEDYYSSEQAAQKKNVTVAEIYRQVRLGKLKSIKIHNARLILKKDLINLKLNPRGKPVIELKDHLSVKQVANKFKVSIYFINKLVTENAIPFNNETGKIFFSLSNLPEIKAVIVKRVGKMNNKKGKMIDKISVRY